MPLDIEGQSNYIDSIRGCREHPCVCRIGVEGTVFGGDSQRGDIDLYRCAVAQPHCPEVLEVFPARINLKLDLSKRHRSLRPLGRQDFDVGWSVSFGLDVSRETLDASTEVERPHAAHQPIAITPRQFHHEAG